MQCQLTPSTGPSKCAAARLVEHRSITLCDLQPLSRSFCSQPLRSAISRAVPTSLQRLAKNETRVVLWGGRRLQAQSGFLVRCQWSSRFVDKRKNVCRALTSACSAVITRSVVRRAMAGQQFHFLIYVAPTLLGGVSEHLQALRDP